MPETEKKQSQQAEAAEQVSTEIDIERLIEAVSRSNTSSATAIIAQVIASSKPEEKSPSQQVEAADQASAVQDLRKNKYVSVENFLFKQLIRLDEVSIRAEQNGSVEDLEKATSAMAKIAGIILNS